MKKQGRRPSLGGVEDGGGGMCFGDGALLSWCDGARVCFLSGAAAVSPA